MACRGPTKPRSASADESEADCGIECCSHRKGSHSNSQRSAPALSQAYLIQFVLRSQQQASWTHLLLLDPPAQQSSTHDEVDPWRPDQKVNCQECQGDDEPQFVEFALGQVPAGREDDV